MVNHAEDSEGSLDIDSYVDQDDEFLDEDDDDNLSLDGIYENNDTDHYGTVDSPPAYYPGIALCIVGYILGHQY